MEKALVNGIQMAYEDRGEGEVVVLLHGFCGSSDYWDAVTTALLGEYRCIVPDLRGHGSTDAPLGAYTVEQMAEDVAELLLHLEVARYTVLGHSMGGYVTLALAERYPERLSGFGLIHSTAYPDSDAAKEKRLQAVAAVQSGVVEFIDQLVPGLFAEQNRHKSSMKHAIDTARQIGYQTPPQGVAGAALAMRERPDRRELLSTADVPVLLLAGEDDSVVPQDRVFTTEGEHITRSVIQGAGHMSMYEAPELLTTEILRFLHH